MKKILVLVLMFSMLLSTTIFDAWENNNNKTISTQIVGKPIKLRLYSNFYVATRISLVDEEGKPLTFRILAMSNEYVVFTKKMFLRHKYGAYKKVRVKIEYCYDKTLKSPVNYGMCSVLNNTEYREANSTDEFAIRPYKFKIKGDVEDFYKSGENITFDYRAVAYNLYEIPAKKYNEKINSSFIIELNDTKEKCVFNNDSQKIVKNNSFHDGKTDVSLQYFETGDEVNLSIHEIPGKEFAKIDENDTSDDRRYIKSDSRIIKIKPYEINYSNPSLQEKKEIYSIPDGNLSEMYLQPRIILKALSKNGSILKDYNSSCYSEDINVSFNYKVVTNENNFTIVSEGATDDNDEINKTVEVSKKDFIEGQSVAEYKFNILKTLDKYQEPIKIIWETSDDYEVKDVSKTVYYTMIKLEGYSDFSRKIEIHKHIYKYDKKWVEITAKGINGVLHNNQITLDKNKTVVEYIGNSMPYSTYLHFDIKNWLWTSIFNTGYQKPSDNNTDCLTHPCLKITFKDEGVKTWFGISENHSETNASERGVSLHTNTPKNNKDFKKLNW